MRGHQHLQDQCLAIVFTREILRTHNAKLIKAKMSRIKKTCPPMIPELIKTD